MAHHGMLLDHYTVTLLDLPTELLIRILSYLPAVDLCAVQRTCRRIHGIVADSTYLQYILLAQINGVDDILPLDCPFSERIKLLRNHEKSWNDLQLNVSHEFSSTMDHLYYLQDGYLVYNLKHIASTPQYGYVDLRSAYPNEELRWVHISIEQISIPVWIESAVDHNLVVVLRYRPFGDLPECEISRVSVSGRSQPSPAHLLSLHSSNSRQGYLIPFRRSPTCSFPQILSLTWHTQRPMSWGITS
jgi:hypothetical protein